MRYGAATIPASLDPQGPAADDIAALWWILFALGVVVFALVTVLLVLPIFRRRRGAASTADRGDVPPAVARRWIVGLGVVLPGVLLTTVLVLSVSTMRAISRPAARGSVVIEVVGYQYWWSARYRESGVTVANEVHVPVGQPVELRLRSADVIHSFWVPALHGKLDLLPDHTNTLVIEASEPGVYGGECAEFCGVQHTKMSFLVIAQPEEEFDAWLAAQQRPAVDPAAQQARRGAEVFATAGCAQCHVVAGVADGATAAGPDLTHVASRRTLASTSFANTTENLTRWLQEPDALKEGTTMPAPELSAQDLGDVVAYLDTLESSGAMSDESKAPGLSDIDDVDTPTVHDPDDIAERMDRLWADPPGLIGNLMAVQNDAIGKRLLFVGFFFLLLGGSVDSLVMRLQLAVPNNGFISPELYNELFTNHGSVTMFLVILPITEGFAILLLPFLLGSREMPFPRLGAYSFFTYLMGGLFYYSSTLFQRVPDAGWFAYTPLSLTRYSPDLALDFWVLGLSVAEVAAIAAGIEIIISILKFRAPGMTLARVPLFAWAMLVTAFMIVFAFTTLVVGSFLLEMSRSYDMKFFDPDFGGSSLLWQHLFWIFGHPEVYIQFLPAAGVVSMVIPVFVRRKIAGYPWLVAAFVAIGFMSFALWAHHMFAVGLPPIVSSFFSAASIAIGIPAGVQIFAWLATMWVGRPSWGTPLLFVTGFLVTFVIGGITGIMVASAPIDLQAHDSYFVVGHLHYVLIGGVAFPIFAAAYFWLPKFTGKLLNERLGRLNFWLMFVGVNITFFPMHIVGLLGMPRRVYTYDADSGWGVYNLISTIGAFVLFGGILVFGVNLLYSRYRGQPAGDNPWGADTLEWSVPSPPPNQGYSVPPIVHSRHPLWDQDDLHTGDPRLVRFLHGLARWPLTWRAAIVTGINDGQPEEVIRVSGPSIWPFVAACGTVLFFIAEMIHRLALLAFAAVAIVVAVLLWNRPEPVPSTVAEEEAFETEHGIPVRTDGGRTLATWGMGLSILVAAIAFATLLLSYFYLRVESDEWPPGGVDTPDLGLAAIAAAAIVASAVAMGAAYSAIVREAPRRLVTWLVIAGGLTVVGGAVQFYDLTRLEFTAQDHAYGSVFYVLAGFLLAVALIGLVIDGVVVGAALQGRFNTRRHAAVTNAARYWVALAVMWLIGAGTIYLVPAVA